MMLGERLQAGVARAALRWLGERATSCCGVGGVWEVLLDPVPAPPPVLRHLWAGDGVEARTFRQFSRHLKSELGAGPVVDVCA